ncbi:hypothetical protein C900_00676 [Fulvivirga imtechensis AK7]|uniref:Uncharacterized protein n=1 Tax=Fulvivirga imtechensis AK7 TaxID=1237149 RepID=L8JL14_9BACT|nr:hypothetical protein C900_00676 [Fulvivirga imtechensis AK7]
MRSTPIWGLGIRDRNSRGEKRIDSNRRQKQGGAPFFLSIEKINT